MSKRLINDLWVNRKRHGLTQNDMALLLLGSEDGSNVSRYERGAREPNFRTALAYQAIFGTPPHKLFPGIYEEVEQEVKQRARLHSKQLGASRASRTGWYKRKLLERIGVRKEDELAQAA